MRQNFIMIHPEGLGMSPFEVDLLPEWERDRYLFLYEEWAEHQEQEMKASSNQSRPSRPRWSKG